jgi:hypothetical protein
MHVHHTKIKQAIQIGCYVSMIERNRVRIFWPQRSVELFAPTVNEALVEMQAVQSILNEYPDYKVLTQDTQIMVENEQGKQMVGTPCLPTDAWAVFEANEEQWAAPHNGRPEEKMEDEAHINGIPKNGTLAYKEGVPALDCPFMEGSPEFAAWNDEWDAAAEEEVLSEISPKVGSVVTNRYRATYSESGHPTHCGDELALLLNSICQNKAGTNLELFEAICAANGVNLAKYNRTSKGWQGRLRMTGRNLLAKRVRENNGVLAMPENMYPPSYTLTVDWVAQAEQKFKPKSEQTWNLEKNA